MLIFKLFLNDKTNILPINPQANKILWVKQKTMADSIQQVSSTFELGGGRKG